MRIPKCFWLVIAGIGLTGGVGCAVPQPRGEGLYQYFVESSTNTGYHLYLPVDYVKSKDKKRPNSPSGKWPLVMTFHGMKPYDNALPQEREWEKVADSYGYIVCAPELRSCDSFMEYPLTREHSYVLKDRDGVRAIMNEVISRYHVDRKRVLSTSWSCGGYLAHYLPNRSPKAFTCIATRLSNFSPSLMIDSTVPLYKDTTPVGIFIGDGDFAACKSESEEAVAWYQARKFPKLKGRMIDNMGHRRIPQTAAQFFAEQMDIQPLHPDEAAVLLTQQGEMTEYNPPGELLAKFSQRSVTQTIDRSTVASAQQSRTDTSRLKKPPLSPRTFAQTPVKIEPPRARQLVFSKSGHSYPVNRTPTYVAQPQFADARPAPKPTSQQPKQTPPPMRVASTRQPKATNPLEPAKPTGAHAKMSTPTGSPTNVNKQTSPQQFTAKPKGSAESPRRKGTGLATRNAQLASASQNRIVPSTQQRTPPLATDVGRPTSARGKALSSSSSSVPPGDRIANARQPAGDSQRARRVNIKLSGTSVGTAPHYVAYSVDLPPRIRHPADFLWMDNGSWIGDEDRGVKIIDTPGIHKITVLVLTNDQQEFRGEATVHVLPRNSAPSASRASVDRTSALRTGTSH